jgi:hypothetical protein
MIQILGFIFMLVVILGPTIFFAKLLSDVKRHDYLTEKLIREYEEKRDSQ